MAAFTDVVPMPIAQLNPELPAVPSAVRGIVTVVWPYSSVSDLFAFTLVEDSHLRTPKGRVRVNLYGPSARAIVASGLSSGDQVLVSLEGVEWEPAEDNRRRSGPGLEWQLKFTNKAQLQVTDSETSETKTVQVDQSPSTETEPAVDAQPEDPTPAVPDTQESTPPPPGPNYFTPAKAGPVRTLVDGEYASPAFVKRARVSYGSLFEDGFDIFEEDGGARGRGRKRSRFGRPSGAWRYTSQSPSPEPEPEPELSASEQDDKEMAKPGNETANADQPMIESDGLRASSPARPQMTDEACQTMEMDLPMVLTPNPVHAADDGGSVHPPQPPDVPVAANSHDGSLDQNHQPVDFGTWPGDSTMAMPPFTDAGKFAHGPMGVESFTTDLQLGVAGDHFHQPWMSQDNFLGNSHNYSDIPAAPMTLQQPGFGSGFNSDNTSNLAAVRFGFGDSDVRDASLSPRPSNAMNPNGLPIEPYSHLGDQQPPFAPATTDYPPLDADGKVFSADTAQQANANPFAAPPPTETSLRTRENAAVPDHSPQSTQAALNNADSSVPAWSAVNSDSHSAPRSSKERSGSPDGHTPESALVIDNSDAEDEIENGVAGADAAGSVTDHRLDPGAVDSQDDLGEAEAEMQYPVDEEPEFEEDDIGDYDTRQYTGPDDDEDDSHDEDLRPHYLEEPFDDGEDEEDDADEDEYESDEEMDDGPPNMQRPPPPASSAPVVIDLLSSDDDDDKEEEEEKPHPPSTSKSTPSNVRSVPTRPAPARTSPEYGPDSEEDEEIKDEEIEDDDIPGDVDDEQVSSDGDSSQVAEDMSESYCDSSGPEESGDDSDGAEIVREEALPTASEVMPVAPAKQTVEPNAMETVKPELPQQTTSPDTPADAGAPVSEAVDEEMKDVNTETEHSVARSPADEDADLQESSPSEIDVVDTSGMLEEMATEFDPADHPSSTEVEAVGPSQETTNAHNGETQAEADPDDDAMVDAPVAPSSPPFTQSFTSHGIDEKHELVGNAPTTGDLEETEAQLPTPMDTQQTSIAKTTISAGENDTFSDAPAETEPVAAETHLEKSVVFEEEEQVSVVEDFRLRPSAPSTGEQVMDTALETSTALTSGPDTETRLEQETVEVASFPASTASQPLTGVEDGREVDDGNDAPSFASQSDHDDALQTLLREEHSKTLDVNDQELSLSRQGAQAPILDAETVTASSPYGDDAYTQEFQSATSSVHGHMAEESQDSESEAPDTSTDQPEFRDAMEIQEHGEDPTDPDYRDEPDSSPVQRYNAFSDASTSRTSQPTSKPRASRQRTSARENTDDELKDPSVRLARASRQRIHDTTDDDEFKDPSVRLARASRQRTRDNTDEDEAKDPSVGLARASRQRTSTRENTDDDEAKDPSVGLARAAIASKRGNRKRDATPEPTHIKTRSSHKSSSPDLGDDSVEIVRASLNTPSKVMAKASMAPRSTSPASSRVDEDTNSVKDLKMKLLRHLREQLPDCAELRVLRQHMSQSIDIMAVALMAPPEPRRAKGGPREYTMSFTITDPSLGPTGVAEVLLYRPHKDSLPKVKVGDIVLLRSFEVTALKGKGFGLRTTEVSSWAVFDKEGESPQIRGPPVEYGEAESTYATCLREWFGLLDEKARDRLAKSNQRIVEAGRAKQ